MYKHGWKKYVGWGPIRQSIVAAIFSHIDILNKQSDIRIWDPFCGSGTIGLVGIAKYYNLSIRDKIDDNFIWQNWNIYKK